MPTAPVTEQKIDGFISDTLPNLIRGKKTLNAIFTSYNGIGSYDDGPLPTPGKKGLKIVLSHGQHDTRPSIDLLVGITAIERADIEMMRQYLKSKNAIGAQDQTQVERKIPQNIGGKGNVLLVSYMGLSAFDTCLKFMRKFRQDIPQAFLVGITCDCDKPRKLRLLASESGEQNLLDSLIITPSCGGRWEMEQVLEALIEQWP